jgi:hypothetical protein
MSNTFNRLALIASSLLLGACTSTSLGPAVEPLPPTTRSLAAEPLHPRTTVESQASGDASGPGSSYNEARELPPETHIVQESAVLQAEAPPGTYPQGYYPHKTNRPHLWALFGSRALDDAEWRQLDQQFTFALTYDMPISPGLSMDVGGYFSDSSTSTATGSPPVYTTLRSRISEFDIGLLKVFYPGSANVRPYIGGGFALSWVSARIYRFSIADDTDFTPGAYGRAGIAYKLPAGGLIGVDFHYLGLTSVHILDVPTDIDSWVGSISLGYEF